MTSEMGEMFNDLKKLKQQKRADNREDSAQYLRDRNIKFLDKNNGAHLIIECNAGIFDFWPGTGLWIMRGSLRKGRGVKRMVKIIAPSNV